MRGYDSRLSERGLQIVEMESEGKEVEYSPILYHLKSLTYPIRRRLGQTLILPMVVRQGL